MDLIEQIKRKTNLELGVDLLTAIGEPHRGRILHYLYDVNGIGEDYEELITSLDAISLVERIIIEKFGKYEYGESLIKLFGMSGSRLSGISSNGICEIATAYARQRAEACLYTLEENK